MDAIRKVSGVPTGMTGIHYTHQCVRCGYFFKNKHTVEVTVCPKCGHSTNNRSKKTTNPYGFKSSKEDIK